MITFLIHIPLQKTKLNVAEFLQLNLSNIKATFLTNRLRCQRICKTDIESQFKKTIE